MKATRYVASRKHYAWPPYILGMIRKNGIVWFARESRKRAWWSTKPIWRILDNIWNTNKTQPDVLYAFYDIAASALTFDVVPFLVLAELQRKQVGCSSLHIVTVPGPAEGFRSGEIETYRRLGAATYDSDYLGWRLRNVVVPCCWLMPSCKQVTVCTSREEAQAFQASLVRHSFPVGYSVRFPEKRYGMMHILAATSKGVVLPTIQATPQACRFVSNWLHAKAGNRKVITITLRECPYEPDRNSNLEAWGAFARSLDPSIYCPVVVRDTEASFKPLPPELDGLVVFPEVLWNIELRAALYELSYLNMFVNNGPVLLCLFNRQTRYIMFKVITPSCSATTEEHYLRHGVVPGSQFKHATPFQRLVWEDDRLEVIQEAFREMCDRIERFSAEEGQGKHSCETAE